MANLFLKKKSKRISTRKRTKIEKKVREHNRKKRKATNPNNKKKKEVLAIPNCHPFREKYLREAEAIKQKRDEEREKKKEKRKEARKNQQNNNRGLDDLVRSSAEKTEKFEQAKKHDVAESVRVSRTYRQEFDEVVSKADVLLEVVDARDPLGTRCPEVEAAVKAAGPDKTFVIVINKIDLVPRANVTSWLKYLRHECPAVAFKASTQKQQNHLSQKKVSLDLANNKLRSSSLCLGADLLLKLLHNYSHKEGVATNITVGVVGRPNVGKSSIINSLKRAKACGVGSVPGLTKTVQQIQLTKTVALLDSPGIVVSSGESEVSLVLRNSIKVETIQDPIAAATAVIARCPKNQLMVHYNLANYSDTSEMLALLARRFGRLKKGGIPDVTKAARILLTHWNMGKISYYTPPPVRSVESSEVVSAFSMEFAIEEETILKSCECAETAILLLPEEMPITPEPMEEEHQVKVTEVKKTPLVPKKTPLVPKKKVTFETVAVLPGNEQRNSARKKEFKKMKKQRTKAEKLSTQLSDQLESAMSDMTAEDYDFSQFS